jgi:polyphosphate glucokinase
MRILVVDVGGTHVKILATGRRTPVRLPSGPTLTPVEMVKAVKAAAAAWQYDVVALGVPSPIVHGHPISEPHNLGPGWVGFDFRRAFGKPVKVINDAAMQALGSYQGGRMLFLGLGTGLGSALIIDGILEPMELGHLPYRKRRTYEDYVGERGLQRLGKKKWRKHVIEAIATLRAAFQADDVVIGGGNAKLIEKWPDGVRAGNNTQAFRGGYRLWQTK